MRPKDYKKRAWQKRKKGHLKSKHYSLSGTIWAIIKQITVESTFFVKIKIPRVLSKLRHMAVALSGEVICQFFKQVTLEKVKQPLSFKLHKYHYLASLSPA